MAIEFENNLIELSLFEELGFSSYLSIFERDIPILPSIILRPLSEENAKEHYTLLANLKKSKDYFSELISRCRETLPILANFKQDWRHKPKFPKNLLQYQTLQ